MQTGRNSRPCSKMTGASGNPAILVACDEPPVRHLLREILATRGCQVFEAGDGLEAVAGIERQTLSLALLKLDLPGMDGRDIIRRVREAGSNLPLIALLPRGEKREKIEAFALGADDYLASPFHSDQVLARVRAAIQTPIKEECSLADFHSGCLTVDLAQRIVTVRGEVRSLTPKEYAILRLLVMNAGKVLTNSFLVHEVWGSEGEVQYLRIYVRQLREKIEPDPQHPAYIITETGVGYRLITYDNSKDPKLWRKREAPNHATSETEPL